MANLTNYDGDPSEHIAIIGMTGRFPGAKNTNEFWQNLRDGVESITFFTSDDLAGTNLDPGLMNNPRYVGADGVIEDMDMFDAEFFNIPPREAELMDPQHRLFLECAWELMELAGYDPERYDGRVAVYGSANLSSYLIRNIMSNAEMRKTATSFQTMLTNDKDFVATRVSYKMNLTGPSMSVATLCSSSFVAIHLACQSLLNYHCDLAMAGAISLQVSRNEAFFYQEGGIGDPDGHCRAFDAKASGTVSGSGIGLIALKRLDEAIENGDYIHAIIKGAAINNDGAIKYSYTAPSIEGQAEVIAEAMAMAEIKPETITYIETHGTGTRLGDPIEVAALTKAFRGNNAPGNQYCAIGSVKTNIGHLVNAGGVASLIKTVLSMQHKQIPPSLNFEEPNPEIDFENSPFYVNTHLIDWEPKGFPRRAGISSFGIGGTNGHIIIEETPEIAPSGESRSGQLLMLSARTENALEQYTVDLLEFLQQHPGINLADVAFTLQTGRREFPYRRMILCRDIDDAISALKTNDVNRVWTRFQQSTMRPVAFMFPGTVEQYRYAGLSLYRDEPAFRLHVDACAGILTPMLELDIRQVLYPDLYNSREQQSPSPAVTNAILFVLEYALAHVWLEWGIQPQAMIGVGTGEYVAGCLAGTLSVEAALGIIVHNTGVNKEILKIPQIPFISGATGTWITEEQATDPAYWKDLSEHTLSFEEKVTPLLHNSGQVLLEVGPGHTLSSMVSAYPQRKEDQFVLATSLKTTIGTQRMLSTSFPHRDGQPSDIACLETLGQLWLAGVKVGWNGFYTHERRHRLPLPTYPFERKRYWIEPAKDEDISGGLQKSVPPEPVKNPDIAEWFYSPVWKTSPRPKLQSSTTSNDRWLLFVDERGVGPVLATTLQQADQEVVTVKAGNQFHKIDEGRYALNLRQRIDYFALFEELKTLDRLPDTIVHLWSITPDADIQSHETFFRQTQDQGFSSVLFLAQALGEYVLTRDIRLWVVSNNTQKVESVDMVYPEKATLLGVCKVIPQENPRIACRYIDVNLPETQHHIKSGTTSFEGAVQQLLVEIRADVPDPIVACRDYQRWVPDVEPIRLTIDEEPIRPLRKNGVYLVTSGLTDISLALIHYLAQTLQARLVVIEGEDFPPRENWMHWLAADSGPDDIIARKIRNIRDLEQAGAEVLVINACLTDVNQLQDAITRIETRFGALHGVIHAVGDMGNETFKTIQDTDEAEGIWHFAPRMQALFVLEKVLAGRNLDFCLLVSSLSSVLGGLGQAAYAAANLFLDAFVASRRGCWLSINWDAWQFETEQQHIAALTPQLAKFAISPAEGIEVFQRIVSTCTSHGVIVSTGDLPARMKRWVPGEPQQNQDRVEKKLKKHSRPRLPNPYVSPNTELERTIAEIWQETLGIEKVGIDDNFFDLGGDSLVAVNTITKLERMLQKKVPTANLYQTPNIRGLAGLLSQDEEQATQERSKELDERSAKLSQRNLILQQRSRK